MAAQSLQEAINLIASRSGVQIALYSDDAEGIFAPALQGDYTVEQALDTVLQGTGLVYERVECPHNRHSAARTPIFEFSERNNFSHRSGKCTGHLCTLYN